MYSGLQKISDGKNTKENGALNTTCVSREAQEIAVFHCTKGNTLHLKGTWHITDGGARVCRLHALEKMN